MQHRVNQKHPDGYVLMFTLVILILMSLMGSVLLLNSTAEVKISSNVSQGRMAFTRAESVAQLSLSLAIWTISTSLDPSKSDIVSSAPSDDFFIEVSPDFPGAKETDKLPKIEALTTDDIMAGYLAVMTNDKPHVTIKQKNIDGVHDIVGTSSVYMVSSGNDGEVESGSSSLNGGTGKNIIYIVVRATGMAPRGTDDTGNYYDEDSLENAHSIVTTIFQFVK